jgi:hypothetical protein
VGQDDILQPVVNRLVADEQHTSNSADAIGAQDTILPHNFSQQGSRLAVGTMLWEWPLNRTTSSLSGAAPPD